VIVWFGLIGTVVLLRLVMGRLNTPSKRLQFLVLAGVVTVAVMGLRHPLESGSQDLASYYRFYDRMAATPWSEIFVAVARFEPGYVLLNKLMATVMPWPQAIILFEAAFCVYCMARFIYRNSEFVFQAMLYYITLGVMVFQLTGFRQAIAMSLCLVAVDFVSARRPVAFIATIVLAATFHQTALVFLVAYPLLHRAPTFTYRLVSAVVIAIGVMGAGLLTDLGNQLFGFEYGNYVGNPFGGVSLIAAFALTIALSIWQRHRLTTLTGLNLTVLTLTLYLMRYITLALERLSFYFASGVVVALPEAVSRVENAQLRTALQFAAIVSAIGLFVYRVFESPWGVYRFFWQ